MSTPLTPKELLEFLAKARPEEVREPIPDEIMVEGFVRYCSDDAVWFAAHEEEPSVRVPTRMIIRAEPIRGPKVVDSQRMRLYIRGSDTDLGTSAILQRQPRKSVLEFEDEAEWSFNGDNIVVVCPSKCKHGIKIKHESHGTLEWPWGFSVDSEPDGEYKWVSEEDMPVGEWVTFHGGDNCHSLFTYTIRHKVLVSPPNYRVWSVHRSYKPNPQPRSGDIYRVEYKHYLGNLWVDIWAPNLYAVCGIVFSSLTNEAK